MSDPQRLVFDSDRWPGVGSGRPLVATAATAGSVWQVWTLLGESDPISPELASLIGVARDRLGRCDPAARLGEAGTSGDALAALAAVVRCAEREPDRAALGGLVDALRNPESVMSDLQAALDRAIRMLVDADIERSSGLSLVLFREHDLEGRLMRSFESDRIGWACAVQARELSSGFHLALVPPPTAAHAVTALAAELGLGGELPCVAMLDALPATLRGDEENTWQVFSLCGVPSVAAELERIYLGLAEPRALSTAPPRRLVRGLYGAALGGPSLLQTRIDDLVGLAIDTGICDLDHWATMREMLLSHLPRVSTARLPHFKAPIQQLRSDLLQLESLSVDGEPALVGWLRSLRLQVHDPAAAAEIDGALAALGSSSSR